MATNRSRSRWRRTFGLGAVVALLAAACSSANAPSAGTAASAAASTAASAAPSVAEASAAPSLVNVTPPPVGDTLPDGSKVVRWFIGLGTGGKPDQLAAEYKVAADFNTANKGKIFLSVEVHDNTVAAQQLQLNIAAGNSPDIIGPVGVEGLNIFRDQVLDLSSLVSSTNYDMSKLDPKLVEFWKMGEGNALIGLPFATYPSFMYYNRKLFDEAKLPYPPTKVGDTYQGKPWDLNTVRELAMKLTVDKKGNDASSPDFDPNSVVQWGFDSQWADTNPLAESAIFGASSLVASDGKTAQIGEPLKNGLKWFNDGVWKDHFIPTLPQIKSALLGNDNEFKSGNLAMAETHSWYMCCINPDPPAKPSFSWGVAVAPAYNGTTTAKLHADTFSMLKGSRNPNEAFQALTTLIGSGELLANYGAFPADPAKQQAFFDTINKQYPNSKIDWDVPKAMLSYVDIPNHQSWVPDYPKTKAALQALGNKYRTTPGLDTDAELATLKTTLQGIFDQAK
ncbi:MAG: sugar ABC transporter substrate-binding protein [Chloroflexota bacterium]